jgi:hypothetical protein
VPSSESTDPISPEKRAELLAFWRRETPNLLAIAQDETKSFEERRDAVEVLLGGQFLEARERWPGGEGEALLKARLRKEITSEECGSLYDRLLQGDKAVMDDLRRLKFIKRARAVFRR